MTPIEFQKEKAHELYCNVCGTDVCNFVEALRRLTDNRDNRGKRHALAFVVAAVVLAILNGRSKVSSIFRFQRNRIEWLREITQFPEAKVISRAHLPRLLARLDWMELNLLVELHFGVGSGQNPCD